MQNRFTILLLVLLSVVSNSCKKEDPIVEELPEVENSEIIFKGGFVSSAHATKGSARVESNSIISNLIIDDFETDNGPDLRVYLSVDRKDNDFVDLGPLKSTSGRFSYSIEQNVDVATYNNVLIWCEDFSVLFGYAELSEP
ncbi:MAG: DM13 domain-containing protein [Salibacteraceae bacterium]